jgi:VCBS repeat-containing protein
VKKIIGYLKNLHEKCFAEGAEGTLRVLHSGDPVYEGERVVDVKGEEIPDALVSAREGTPERTEATVDTGTQTAGEGAEETPKKRPPATVKDEFDAPVIEEVQIEARLLEAVFRGDEIGTVTVSHHGNNDPIAHDDFLRTQEDASLRINVFSDLLANDGDPDGDALYLDSFSQPSHGSVVDNGDGTLTYYPDTNYNGPDSFSYIVGDGRGGTASATVYLTVSVANDAPVLDLDGDDSTATGSDFVTTFTENGSAVSVADGDITITDADDTHIESATIVLTNAKADDTLTIGTLPAGISGSYDAATHTVTLTGSASLADYQTAIQAVTFSNSSDNPDTTERTITVTVNDGDADSNTATTTVHITAVNDAPVAVDHNEIFNEDTIVNDNLDGTTDGDVHGTVNLLTGASDVDSTNLSIVTVNGSSANVGNAVTVNFTYTDKNGNNVNETLDVTVNSDGSYFIAQKDLNAIPLGENPTATLTYQVGDGSGGVSGTQTLTLTIKGQNDVPDAVDDTLNQVITHYVDVTPDHAAINVGNGIVLSDGFTISQKIHVTGAGMVFNKESTYEVAIENDGSVRYALRASDGSGWIWNDTGVDIAFNTDMVLTMVYDGATQTLKTYIDGQLFAVSTQNVPTSLYSTTNELLFGERGSNNQPLEGTFDDIRIYDRALSGAEVAAIGNVTTGLQAYYDFETSNALTDKSGNGNDAILQNGASIATVNAPPTEDTPFTVLASTLLANDSDVDSASFQLVSVQNAQHGTVSLDSDGNVVFTPDTNYFGPASFTYTIQDDSGDTGNDTDTATVSFTIVPVNDRPEGVDHSESFQEDDIVSGNVTGSVNVLDGASDIDDASAVLSVASVNGSASAVGLPVTTSFAYTDPSSGAEVNVDADVRIDADGSFTILQTSDVNAVPDGVTATGVLTYTIQDDDGKVSAPHTLTLTITGENDAPDAVDDNQYYEVDHYVDVTPDDAAINVGKSITFTDAFTISQKIHVTGAGIVFNKENTYEVAIESDGSVRYAMNGTGSAWVWNDTGVDIPLNTDTVLTIVYDGTSQTLKTYIDGTLSATSTSNVPTVLTSANDSRYDLLFGARSGAHQPIEGTFDDIRIYDRALSDGEVSSIDSVTNGLVGAYDFEGSNPLADDSGSGNDATLQNGASLEIQVVATGTSIQTDEDTPLVLSDAVLLVNDNDVDGDPLSLISVSTTANTHGSVSYDSVTGAITYTPDVNFSGTATFDYTITDTHGATDTATVTINVTPVNDDPVAQDDSGSVYEDSTLNVSASSGVLANDSDVDGDALNVSAIRTGGESGTGTSGTVGQALVGTYGTLTLNSDGSYTYTADQAAADALNDNENGTDTFTYTVSDGNGGTDTAELVMTVTGVNDAPTIDNVILRQPPPENVVFWYDIDSDPTVDKTGNGHTASQVSGTNIYTTNDAGDINLSTYEQKIIAASFTTSTVSASDPFQVIYEQGGSKNGYNISIVGDHLYAVAWGESSSSFNTNDPNGSDYAVVDLGQVASNTTYNVVLVHDATASNGGTVTAYLDGVQSATVIEGAGTMASHSGDVGIGGYKNDTIDPTDPSSNDAQGDGAEFTGTIHELLTWNTAQSAVVGDINNYLNESYDTTITVSAAHDGWYDIFDVDASDAEDDNDGDSSTHVVYTLNATYNGLFGIDSATGIISVDGDRLFQSTSYTLDITVTDSNGATDTEQLTVNVTGMEVVHLAMNGDTDDIADSGMVNDIGRLYNGASVSSGDTLVLDGIDDYLDFARSEDIDKGTFPERSVAFWFKTSDAIGTQYIYAEGGGIRSLQIYTENGILKAKGYNTPTSENNWQATVLNSNINVADGNWHHVAITTAGDPNDPLHSLDSNGFKLYLDGDLKDTDTGGALWGHANAHIGSYYNGTQTFEGEVDGFRLYNDVLTDAQVQELSSATVYDGIVSGLYYETTDGISGYTDEEGHFLYKDGDVTFKVGEVTVGTIEVEDIRDGKVFLQDIAGTERTDLENDYVENMAIFLQSLDADGNPDNGIELSEEAYAIFSDETIDLSALSQEGVVDLLEKEGYEAVDEGAAMEHVAGMLRLYGGVEISETLDVAPLEKETEISIFVGSSSVVEEAEATEFFAMTDDPTVQMHVEEEIIAA